MNAGLRYEITTPFIEVADRAGNLVPELKSVFRVNTPELPGRGVNSFKNLAPRLGFAYSLDSKTVVRTGYGRFYSYPGIASGRSKTPPTRET